MPNSPNKLTLFFAELKRRGVTRLATIYAVVGLGVIEAFDIIGGRFLIPDWTIRVVIILVLGGFPVAMILGWIYDLTSKGIEKTKALTPSQRASISSLSWKPSWISVILLVILILTTTAFFTVPRPNALGFKQQDWVLIADLENNTADEVFEKSVIDHGWKIPTIHNLQATMAKYGKEVKSVKVFELCHPDHAGEILTENEERIVSSLMPCRVSFYEMEDGSVHISRMNSGLMAKTFGGVIAKVMAVASADVEIMLKPVLN